MFDEVDIYNMMIGGASTDEIADAFANALNGAMKMKEKENEKKKIQEAEYVLSTFVDFLEKYYPDSAGEFKTLTAEQFIKSFESSLKLAEQVNKLLTTAVPTDKKTTVDKDNMEIWSGEWDKVLEELFGEE